MTFEEWGKENSDTRSRYHGELYSIIENMYADWKAEREELTLKVKHLQDLLREQRRYSQPPAEGADEIAEAIDR